MKAEIEIIKPSLALLPEVLELWRQQHQYHVDLDPGYYTPITSKIMRLARGYFRRTIETDNPYILVARFEQRTVGFITFGQILKPDDDADVVDFGSNSQRCGEIIDLFVEQSYRRRDIGGCLMRQAEGQLGCLGIKRIKVLISSANPDASDFYEYQGYTPQQVEMYKNLST